jgi:hypothetical protein
LGAVIDFRWVEPTELLISDAYQRSLSKRSLSLIKRIVSAWDWRKFKPPIVAQTRAGLEVIDGQHTSIAAASHPDVAKIPVMIVKAEDLEERAAAFIGHNVDRVPITPMQLHHAAVTAGDVDARAVAEVCRDAGVRVLRHPPANGAYAVGDTLAVTAIHRLVSRRGVRGATVVLRALSAAECAPVSASEIKALEMLLFDDEFSGSIDIGAIENTIAALGGRAELEARRYASTHGVPYWKALGITIFRNRRVIRRA